MCGVINMCYKFVIIQTDLGFVSGNDSLVGLLFNKKNKKPYYIYKHSSFLDWLKRDIDELNIMELDFNILDGDTNEIIPISSIFRGLQCQD